MEFLNSWGNAVRAESYSSLEFPNTYYLAYRDLPEIIGTYTTGNAAVDFGCGTGRSTRFLKKLGFDAVGVDISEDMLYKARQFDTLGSYYLVNNGEYDFLGVGKFDLVLSVFTFDNIPYSQTRIDILKGLRRLLKPSGVFICLDSTPQLYHHEWASFSTHNFPGNRNAQTGDIVKVIMTDVPGQRPVEDIFCSMEDYHKSFESAGLRLLHTHYTMGYLSEPYPWKSELSIPPWMIFVLKPQLF